MIYFESLDPVASPAKGYLIGFTATEKFHLSSVNTSSKYSLSRVGITEPAVPVS